MSALSTPETLRWYDVSIRTKSPQGTVTTFHTEFLCLNDADVIRRAEAFAAAQNSQLIKVELELSKEKEVLPDRFASKESEPAGKKVERDLTEEEKRVVAAFTLLPIEYTVTSYVKGEGGTA
jgi:hypothetical protein